MNSETPVKTYALADGCRAVVNDMTRHYYGGYFHVRLQVEAEVALSVDWFENRAAYEDALGRLGSRVTFQRLLEKMAVPEPDIDNVRQDLISTFEANLLPYLVRADFPRRFVFSEYAKSLASVTPLQAWQPR